jgi:hypothetical protein
LKLKTTGPAAVKNEGDKGISTMEYSQINNSQTKPPFVTHALNNRSQGHTVIMKIPNNIPFDLKNQSFTEL